jgi:hypothetical protein
VAKELKDMTAGERLRSAALGTGLRSSFHNLNACYSSADSAVFFTASEAQTLQQAEGLVLGVILAARSRGMVV